MKTHHIILLVLAVVMMVFGFITSADSNRLAGVALILGGSLIISAIIMGEAIINRNISK